MSTTTTNLGLFKYNIDTDSHLAFNINQALNDNWDIIDEFAASGGTGASRNIGEIVVSTIPFTDAGLHLLDGSLINGSGSYSSFVNYIAGLVNIYPDCFTTESNWQSSVSSYGVCGKFVYNSINNTVRLPKYNNKIYTSDFENNAPVVGTGMVLGLTNGTGTAGFAAGTYAVVDPTAYGEDASTTGASNTRLQGLIGVTTDPSKSGLIAQLSDITTSLKGYYYIVIANSIKTDIQVDIDNITTDLNGKADIDLDNINASQSAKDEIVSWGMPDWTTITALPSTVNLVQQADEDIILWGGAGSGVLYVALCDSSGTIIQPSILAITSSVSGYATWVYSPIFKKGSYFKITAASGSYGLNKIYLKKGS